MVENLFEDDEEVLGTGCPEASNLTLNNLQEKQPRIDFQKPAESDGSLQGNRQEIEKLNNYKHKKNEKANPSTKYEENSLKPNCTRELAF